jgi:hypothetical protein
MSSNNKPPYYEFPYVKFHGRSYPLIPISINNKKNIVNTFALIDSGASFSVFRPDIATALHLPLKSSRSMKMGTPLGGLDIAISAVEMKVGDTKFKTRIGFSKNFTASFNILGREGFFRHFSVCFNEAMKTVIMVPLRGLPK